MGHHLESASTDCIHNLGPLFDIGDLELLLQEDRRLLIGTLDNAGHEGRIRRGRRRVEQGQKVDGLQGHVSLAQLSKVSAVTSCVGWA